MSLGRGFIVTLRNAFFALLALGAAGTADAQTAPVATPGGDPRIKQVMYDADAIVPIRGVTCHERESPIDTFSIRSAPENSIAIS